MFDLVAWLAFLALVFAAGAFAWYLSRGRSPTALKAGMYSLLAAPALLIIAFAMWGGGGDPEVAVPCDCPGFARAVEHIAWFEFGVPIAQRPLTEGTRAGVSINVEPITTSDLERLVNGLGVLGAETVDPQRESGSVRTPLIGRSRTEARIWWGPDFLRVRVSIDSDHLDDVVEDLEAFRDVFGTVGSPRPVIESD